MEEVRELGIYIPSYKRADTIITHQLLEYYKVVVRESEKEEYEERIPAENIIAVPDEEIDSLVKVCNWIIDNAKEDIICILGDDIPKMIYRLDHNDSFDDPETVTSEIERIAQLMVDLGIGYGCTDASIAPWNYDKEFHFAGTSGGVIWVNKKVYSSRFNEKVGYCCDTDVVFQELLKNRIILKPKYLCDKGGTDTNKGGNSSKSRNSMVVSFELMKQKWGKYFRYDLKTNKIYILVPR